MRSSKWQRDPGWRPAGGLGSTNLVRGCPFGRW